MGADVKRREGGDAPISDAEILDRIGDHGGMIAYSRSRGWHPYDDNLSITRVRSLAKRKPRKLVRIDVYDGVRTSEVYQLR